MNRFLPSVGMERTTTLELQKNKESMKRIFKEVWSKGNMEVLDDRIEEEVAARINLLAELSKEARGVRERGGKALKRSVRIGG
jgi:hypothetical protein